jgi:hypothetical protein
MPDKPIASVGGRPSKLTTTAALRIVSAILDGKTKDRAARAAGVGASTLYRWEATGRAGREPFAAFVEAVRRAEDVADQANSKRFLDSIWRMRRYL